MIKFAVLLMVAYQITVPISWDIYTDSRADRIEISVRPALTSEFVVVKTIRPAHMSIDGGNIVFDLDYPSHTTLRVQFNAVAHDDSGLLDPSQDAIYSEDWRLCECSIVRTPPPDPNEAVIGCQIYSWQVPCPTPEDPDRICTLVDRDELISCVTTQ